MRGLACGVFRGLANAFAIAVAALLLLSPQAARTDARCTKLTASVLAECAVVSAARHSHRSCSSAAVIAAEPSSDDSQTLMAPFVASATDECVAAWADRGVERIAWTDDDISNFAFPALRAGRGPPRARA